jgi:hypothetical protein
MQNQITFLDVERLRREAFRYTLRPPYDPANSATLRSWDVVVDPDTVDSFCEMLATSVKDATERPGTPGIQVDPFVARGRGLFDALFPYRRDRNVEDLRTALCNVRTPLLITHDDPGICWELLNDGVDEGFLGLKLNIGRRLRSRNVPERQLRRAGEWRCLVIADPNPDEPQWALPGAREEAEKLCGWLRQNRLPAIEFLSGEEANYGSVLDRLAAHAYDVIHYAGHIVHDSAKKEYALRLHGGRLLGADTVRDHVQGAPVVFLNSCWSAHASGIGQQPSSSLGMTDAFLEAGAQAVIGSLFPAPDLGGRAFAEQFYRAVLDGNTLGEAMCMARKAVKDNLECGPAWACFVLFGDPCLRIEASVVENALRGINLYSSQFSDEALGVLEAAHGYAGSLQPLSTAHFFAALIDGPGSFLADALRQQGVTPHKLRDVFRELFEQQRKNSSWSITSTGSAGFSTGVRDMLWASVTRSRAMSREKVEEEDLLFAFVQMSGGSTGELLRKVGVDILALSPEAKPVEARLAPVSIGPLKESDCEAEAWQALEGAAREALGDNLRFVGTPQLFQALCSLPDSLLARGLTYYGVAFRGNAESNSSVRLSGKIECSDNLKGILLMAQANAAAGRCERLSCRDLLDAFIAQGGGEVGRHFMEKGILLEVLVSDLFLDGGELDLGRFTEEGNNILDEARGCAVRKGCDRIDRDHLLYGMLLHSAKLRRSLAAAGCQAQTVIDRLYTRIPSGLSSSGKAALRVAQMTPLLLKVLWLAAAEAGEKQSIDDIHLLRAWLREGGGHGAELLIEYGLSLSGLAEWPAE